jgi:ferritin-like metal-binding protein YciE
MEVILYMQLAKPTPLEDEFESALIVELEELRKSEKALQKMYPRLRSKPQLRARFLDQLSQMQQRASRLDAVLNPIGAMSFAAPVPATIQSSVA